MQNIGPRGQGEYAVDRALGGAPLDAAGAAFRLIERAWLNGDGTFPCWLSATRTFVDRTPARPEIFTAMLVLEMLKQTSLSDTVKRDILHMLRQARTTDGLHHFFTDRTALPADADCTAIAHSLLWSAGLLPAKEARRTAERILGNRDSSGVLAVYFTDDPARQNVVDPAVCANALHFLAQTDMWEGVEPTVSFLQWFAGSNELEQGTRYYPCPDAFLFFLARAVSAHPSRLGRLWTVLTRRIQERQDASRSPLEMAFRVAAANLMAVPADEEREALRRLQAPDAGWPADVFFKYGRSGVYFGSEALTTAFALYALDLDVVDPFDVRPKSPRRTARAMRA